jgi:hypothetical protein
VNEDLMAIQRWALANGLSLNASNACCVVLRTS